MDAAGADHHLRQRWHLDDWEEESQEIWFGIDRYIEELAGSVELPAELLAHEEAAGQDDDFADSFDEWFGYLQSHSLLLAIEQSCEEQGILLPADQRALRLCILPTELQSALGVFMRVCPRHVRALLIHEVYWLVRFERINRTGSPELRLRPNDRDAASSQSSPMGIR